MLRLVLVSILIGLLARAFWRVVDGIVEGLTGRPARPRAAPRHGVHMVRDPVCGTFVVPERAVSLLEGSARVYFCSSACRDSYRTRGTPGPAPARESARGGRA